MQNPSDADARAVLRERRARLSAAVRIAAASAVAAHLDELPGFLAARRVAGYWAVGGELPLHAAVARLGARGQRYCLPILAEDRRLRFAPFEPGAAVRPNRHGIPEPESTAGSLMPEDLDLVLAPLIAFDRSGRRLGMGGGYYDRSFAFLRDLARPARPLLVGIGYAFQEIAALPARDWDVALDFVATENGLIDCSAP